MILCAICKKETKEKVHTIRRSWCDAGGWGDIPDSAIVHPSCDKKEQAAIKNGRIKLSDLWVKVQNA